MIQAVFFDLDGVLIDSEYFYLLQNQKFLQMHGKKVREEDLYSVVGTPMQKTYEMIHSYFIEDGWSMEQLMQRYDAYWDTIHLNFADILNPTVRETLTALKEKGLQLGLASSSTMEGIQKVIRECDLGSFFSVVLSGDQFRMSKPDPEIYLTCAATLGVAPQACVVVEDSVYGIEAGKRAGMKVIAMKERFHHDQSKADAWVERLEQIIPIIEQS